MDKPIPIIAIEQKYEVEKIKVNGIHFWPFLRNYIGSQIHFKKNRRVKPNKAYAFELVKTLFYSFNNWFNKAEYVFLSSNDQRRLIDGKYADRMDFFIDKIQGKKTLLIELANPSHYPKASVKTKNIVSKTWFYLIEKFYSYFTHVEIENEGIISAILEEYQLDTNYKELAKSFISQYKHSYAFFKQKRTKKLFLTTAYINAARVKAAHDLGIEVIEFQHGIINTTHYAYNVSKNIDESFYPDYLLSFGLKEKEVFSSENYYIKKDKVFALGSFYIDYLVQNTKKEHQEILSLKKKYKKIIAMSCQDAMDELWVPFFKAVSEKDLENAYILMPRHQTKKYYEQFNFSNNVFFIPELNTYEIMMQADLHTTINSTTAIESISLGTPNILMNINNLAKTYLETTLKSHCYFADSPEEFINLVNTIAVVEKSEIVKSNQMNIMSGFKSNIDQILEKIEA